MNATPAQSLTPAQAKLALQKAIQLHVSNQGLAQVEEKFTQNDLIVYVDKNNKAHWAYLVSFASGMTDGTPAIPTFILDATTLNVYEQWNNLQSMTNVKAGGFGGNPKFGRKFLMMV